MTATMLIDLLVLLLLVATGWLIPRMQGPTLPFGVRVPPDRVDAPVIREAVHTYTTRVVASSGAILVLTALLFATTGASELGSVVIGLAAIGLVLLSMLGNYLLARRAIRREKIREDWYAGRKQGVTADTALRTDPEPFPWLWTLPTIAVIIATVVLAVGWYPSMPAIIATHYRRGIADGLQPKSVVTVALPIITQVLVSTLIVLVVAFGFRARASLDPAAPRGSSWQYRIFLRRISRAILGLMFVVNVSLLLIWTQLWRGVSPEPWVTAVSGGLVVFGVSWVLLVALQTGQGGRRLPVPASVVESEGSGVIERDDDRFWRAGGLFYVNRDDPAILIPKRIGVGWTVNLGNPWGAVIIAATLLIALGIALRSALPS